MLKVTAKFTEKIWDKEANAEIPFELAYVGEALAVSAQKKGFSIQQKFNGRTCGMFFNYKDLSKLTVDTETFEDFKDLDNIESKVAALMATKKLTILGSNFKLYDEDKEEINFSSDINVTVNFNKGIPLNWYIKPDDGYHIQFVEVENAAVETDKLTNDGLCPFTIKGIVGNVLLQVETYKEKNIKEEEDTGSSSDDSGSDSEVDTGSSSDDTESGSDNT